MTILFHTHLAQEFPETIDALRERHPDHAFVVARSEEEFTERLKDADGIVAGPVPEDTLERAAALRIQFIPFAGVNRAPLRYFRERGLTLCNSHGNAPLVAERAVALALAAAGRVVEFDQDLRRGLWHRRDDPDQPFDYWQSLLGKRVTVLGVGAIGSGIAGLMRPFGGRITGCRRRRRRGPGQRPADCGPEFGASVASSDGPFDEITTDLDGALRSAEILFIALPLTPASTGLLGAPELELLRGSILVNVSRAEIVEEEPLYRALHEGALHAAGLDVWYSNPEQFTDTTLPSSMPFHELSNVVMSPHAGSHATEGKRLQMEGTIANVHAYLSTGAPLNRVDLDAGY